MQSQFAEANSLLERVLFVYEDSISYDFRLLDKRGYQLQLDQYSRPLFVALSRFLLVLTKKGCHKSAFEYAKVLLRLNPYEDPHGALILVDHHALTARQYTFVTQFPHLFGKDHYPAGTPEPSLIYLPSSLYSTALAKFLPAVENGTLSQLMATWTREQFLDILARIDDMDPAAEDHNVLLLLGLLLYPKVMNELASTCEWQKLSLGEFSAYTGWQKKPMKELLISFIFANEFKPFYSCLQISREEDLVGLDKFSRAYVESNKALWKSQPVGTWARSVIGCVLNYMTPADYEAFVERLCSKPLRYVVPFSLSRYQSIVPITFGDHPGLDLNNILANQQEQGHQPPPNYNPINTQQNWFSLLLGSLLPWNHLPREGLAQEEDQPPEGFEEDEDVDFDDRN
eukprot:TRINITY_DN10452_c0_g1_i1.p1 TRINITY_DN10452_c0_g1~~TRINITY_DN10452_c0_g1_i1.p1  ORF type:complete len:399 (+),score=66.09 TRINITY_DN10452_c0_g1_i1:249-1445(+)